MKDIGNWKDRWLFTPLPDMSEPEKAICNLTDFQDDPDNAYPDDDMTYLYNKTSMHGVYTYFMLIRRRISLLEHAIPKS